MRMRALLGTVLMLLLGGLAVATEQRVDFVRDIKPIFQNHCASCHGALKQKGGLRLDAGTLIHRGAKSGPVLMPGNARTSVLIQRLVTMDEADRMPPDAKPLLDHDIDLIRKWISAGAEFPANEEIPVGPQDHWFVKEPTKRPQSEIADSRSPIDHFIERSLTQKGLTPRERAEPLVIVRRIYLDLVGVPPSPREVEAFLLDQSPGAFERLVDRLLADSRYGQRWARHFMDIWRYTDEVIFEEDLVVYSERHIWQWRDWIIESLNANKPFDRMIVEMFAGDEIAPTDPKTLAATGYLVRSQNVLNGQDGWTQDVVEHTGMAFMGLTMRCARCHDHKYDPISQDAYYRMRAIFEPMRGRIDHKPGVVTLKIDGLPRVFDGDLTAKTAFYEHGNSQTKRLLPDGTEEAMPPGTPEMLRLSAPLQDIAPQPVELPLAAYRPTTKGFVYGDRLHPAIEEFERAKQRELDTIPNSCAIPSVPEADVSELPDLSPEEAKHLEAVAKRMLAEAVLTELLAGITADHLTRDMPWVGTEPKDKDNPEEQKRTQRVRSPLEAAAEVARRLKVIKEKEVAVASAIVAAKSGATDKAKEEGAKKFAKAQEERRKELVNYAKPILRFTPLAPSFPTYSTGRRLAFARWLTDPHNPATARVLVNHVWMRHFGRPLVDTVMDFGLHGAKPSHPDLLDWLARDLIDSGWDLKRLHRLLVTSDAYRRGSARIPDSQNEKIDPDNRYLWRMNSQRMQSEQVRDSILAVSGKLDYAHGGKPIPSDKIDRVLRRSVYFRHAQGDISPMMAMFDAADPNECYRREESIVPQQSLALANSRLGFEQSRIIADQIMTGAKGDDDFIRAAFSKVLTRSPTPAELDLCRHYLQGRRAVAEHAPAADDHAGVTEPAKRPRDALIHVLLNHTDFVTIR